MAGHACVRLELIAYVRSRKEAIQGVRGGGGGGGDPAQWGLGCYGLCNNPTGKNSETGWIYIRETLKHTIIELFS